MKSRGFQAFEIRRQQAEKRGIFELLKRNEVVGDDLRGRKAKTSSESRVHGHRSPRDSGVKTLRRSMLQRARSTKQCSVIEARLYASRK